MDRRQILLASGSALTIALAGCSSDEGSSDDGSRSTPTPSTPTPSEPTPGNGGTEVDTDTEGNDDDPFGGSAGDLITLSREDLPASGWEQGVDSQLEPNSDAALGFRHSGETVVQVVTSVDLYENVSEARTEYDAVRSNVGDGSSDSEGIESLDVASESFSALNGSFVAFRDANAVGSVLIQGEGDVFERLDAEELAAIIHGRWRE